MLYMLLLYSDPGIPFPEDGMQQHFAIWREAHERGAYVASEALGLGEASTTLRVRDGELMITDGPFAETREVLGGFYLLDCKNLDEALEYAAKIPDARTGAVEVRPVMAVPEWPYGATADRERMPIRL